VGYKREQRTGRRNEEAEVKEETAIGEGTLFKGEGRRTDPKNAVLSPKNRTAP